MVCRHYVSVTSAGMILKSSSLICVNYTSFIFSKTLYKTLFVFMLSLSYCEKASSKISSSNASRKFFPGDRSFFIFLILFVIFSNCSLYEGPVFVDCIFCLSWQRCPFAVASVGGNFLVIHCEVSPGHDVK